MTSAWTLGFVEGYEKAVRIPGNAKAPSGIIFSTKLEALTYLLQHPENKGFAPYEVILPGPWDEVTTRDRMTAHRAFHEWHTTGEDAQLVDLRCAVCREDDEDRELGAHALLKEAPFVNPDEARA